MGGLEVEGVDERELGSRKARTLLKPAYLVGAQTITAAMWKDEERIREAFRTGRGLGWHEHCHDLFHGTEKLLRPGYLGNLVSAWIPALDGVDAKLRAGAKVADIGCGHGSSTILLAEAYPESEIVGFDYHAESIATARKRAAEAGCSERVAFEVASAQDFPGTGYDLVCIFDALHDMGDPVGAARHIRAAVATMARGSWSSPWPSPASRTMSTPSAGSSTPGRSASARQPRSRSVAASRSAIRCQTRTGKGCSPAQGSGASVGRRRRRSTERSRCGPSRVLKILL
jgi:hypothetical protein